MRLHRSLLLVPAVVMSAACTGRDDAAADRKDPLDRDLTLTTQLGPVALASAAENGGGCRAEPTPAAPTADARTRAAALEQRAAEAEFVGDTRAARDLHRQAARLDATSEEIAYRLARAEETLGDRGAAAGEYCRFLALAPNARNASEVRARLTALTSPAGPTASGVLASSSTSSTSTTSATSAAAATTATASGRRSSLRVAAKTPVTYAVRRATPAPSAASSATTSVASAAEPSPERAPDGANGADGATVESAAAGEVATTQDQQPAPAPARRERVENHTARNAAIGAVAGAAIGGISSRSVKGAGIGAAVGGILGAVSGQVSAARTPGFAN